MDFSDRGAVEIGSRIGMFAEAYKRHVYSGAINVPALLWPRGEYSSAVEDTVHDIEIRVLPDRIRADQSSTFRPALLDHDPSIFEPEADQVREGRQTPLVDTPDTGGFLRA